MAHYHTLFSSMREVVLWVMVLLVLMAIALTLVFASSFAGLLENPELISGLFWVGIILTPLSVVTQAFSRRPNGIELGVALGMFAVYLITFLRFSIPAERSHLIEYTILTLVVYEAVFERVKNGRKIPVPPLMVFVGVSFIGVLDESIQLVMPNRVFDPVDIGFNCLAVFLAVFTLTVLRTISHWFRKSHNDSKRW